jgi:hypothetical protein
VKKYEIWGLDEIKKHGLLAYATLDSPTVGDTILVRGQVRDIQRVWRHHAGAQATPRVLVDEISEAAAA